MMRNILVLGVILFFVSSVYSQDVITTKAGEDIMSKVLEVNQNEIKYLKYEMPDGPVYSVSKTDILMIRYENGSKDIFNEAAKSSGVDYETCLLAQEDSKINYTGKKTPAAIATGAATILFTPLLGVIPGAVFSSTEPLEENLRISNFELMKDPIYNKCYKEQAFKTKKRQVWTAYGICSAVWLGLLFIGASQ